MRKITEAGVRKYLDRLVKATKRINAIGDYNESIGICNLNETSCVPDPNRGDMPYVHLSNGMHEIGKLLGIAVDQYKENDDYRYYSFVYDDVLFIQLDRKEDEV